MKIFEHDLCTGVVQFMKNIIAEAVDKKWINKIKDEVMGFTS